MSPSAFLHPAARPAQDDFITVVRGQGALLWDDSGREYVDAMASLWYCNIGHGREDVIAAITSQLHTLDAFHTFDRFTNEPAEQLCARIAALAPMDRARVHLTSGGSESVEAAMKLARITHSLAGNPQRTIIISRTPSYHGVTYGGTSATGMAAFHDHVGPLLPDVVQVPYDDVDALAALLAEGGDRVAAVIAEPVVGAPGVYPAPAGYLPAVRALCDEYGALLILDEVICAFGRLGAWWGADRYGVRPDMVTFAKAVTSGYIPLGGVAVGPAVLDVLDASPDFVLRHGHTYSGHPTACAAALAVLDVTEQEGLLDRALKVGQRLGDGLRSLVDGTRVVEVRGDGAMFGVGLAPGLDAVAVRERLLGHGVIARPIGTSTVAFCPPLVITDDQIDRCLDGLAASLP